VFYILLWFVTHLFGVPQVYRIVKDKIPVNAKGASQPSYSCRAVAYAPFLVRGDFAWQAAPLIGEGGSALYLWLFGVTVRVYELEHWLS
jgi:hypothetical protein